MKPLAPFQTWPVHLSDRRFGLAWYTRPGVFVDQIHEPHGTLQVAQALHAAIDHVLERQQEDLEQYGGLLVIHDWRQMHGYDSDARKFFLERMKTRKPGYLRGAVVVVPDTPLLKMAVQTSHIVMALRAGGTLKLATNLREVLETYGVSHPTRGDWK